MKKLKEILEFWSTLIIGGAPVFLIIGLMFYSCYNDITPKDEEESTEVSDEENVTKSVTKSSDKVGKYIYVDTEGCIHTNRSCRVISCRGPINREQWIIAPVDTSDFSTESFEICGACVTDAEFEHLTSIVRKNNSTSTLP